MKIAKIIQSNQTKWKKRLTAFALAFTMICTLIMPFPFAPTVSVAAAEGDETETVSQKVEVSIDYIEEIIEAYPMNTDDENVISVMYALGLKGNDTASLAKAKWMPLYGEYLDISKYIPKKEGSAYYVAFKEATDTGLATATTIELKPRPAVSKTEVVYDNEKQQITTSQTGTYYVKLGASLDWITLDKETPISLPLDFLPNGSTAVFKKAASDSESTPSFASAEIKLKLPKQSKAPKVDKVVIVPSNESKGTDAYLKGITEKMELMLSDESGEPIVDTKGNEVWATLSKNITLADLEKLLKAKSAVKLKDTGNKNYLLTVRLAASGTKGASGKSLISLDISQYDAALSGDNLSAASATATANLTAGTTEKIEIITITLTNATFAANTNITSELFKSSNTGIIDFSFATHEVLTNRKVEIGIPVGTALTAGEVTITIVGTALTGGKTPDNDLKVKVNVKAAQSNP